ncbi:Aminoglycoside phosphotransferase OS=Tsukamurella paurometabola (strain ATCC 8368 / DSM / CCUG 35730 / CIP 100753 / JCM 10117 / KCTC 9821 / NBRC 16120 /NCIMB 702349 / NCTC 13040) OX=521096 GN=Tpau_3252 PE=3 SV=1 [Tsukamurella paurometabola]|uniref:Aminoglycoside phosphotransferase n=1 Tax=Tsukamurella paurometabola (strain ATCC 8368 / DSM 20162 / CCUG 35730 / CIP 100753 / JCM 10117 / KCTC 9821 / NBRC 16120 / NCIMB 702349 / NCTC 13040) TaxID=521096 RepID=D5UVQ5_TSUPD|nr:phosphotransferase [Tsukamurella paurometabola]ADG79837.1 aminoglycoside phosphotransferase [Tsukamurella paurometabola DSM 20162]SUP37383.1 Phosphotransferase enzyme family [Tsukamurella paurometabola]
MTRAPDRDIAARLLAPVWPGVTVEPLLESENATFRVRGGPRAAVLRLHRPGYQNDAAITSELDWIEALRRDTGVPLVEPLRTNAGRVLADPVTRRRAVLFAELPGGPVPEEQLDAAHFTALGDIAATFHDHAQHWDRPAGFTRFSWDVDDTIGRRPRWGDWRAGLGVTPGHRRAIAPAAARAAERIDALGRTPDRYGLIHGDLRAANLITAGPGFTVIDFDDSGFGWHLFEFAAAASFVETDPRLSEWAASWTAAYRRRRALPDDHIALLPDFVILRRLQLLGWLGTHAQVREADPGFADGTVELAQAYLAGRLLSST